MIAEKRKQLSKLLSLILRHTPERLGLRLDEHGWVPLAELLSAVQRQRGWEGIGAPDVHEVVVTSDKQRFEIEGERIRARYGHSVPGQIRYPEAEPPEVLYHGTTPRSLPAIRREGLRSMQRQYVHLSTTVDQARQVGRRHAPDPVVLIVRAHVAWRAGVKFYWPEERLFLAETVPPSFIEVPDETSPEG